MIFSAHKNQGTNEMLVKITLPNNHFIFFNAHEVKGSKDDFCFEIKRDHAFLEWIESNIDKRKINPS